jgi:hypothetical protein
MAMNTRTPIALAAAMVLFVASSADARDAHRRGGDDRVYHLAHEIADSAHDVGKTASRSAHHGDLPERRALRSLREVDDRARRFRSELKHYGPYDYRTERAYYSLSSAMTTARNDMRGLHAFRHVEHEFGGLEYLARDLGREYRALIAHHRPSPRRYGHDSHGRRGVSIRFGRHFAEGYASIGYRWTGSGRH